jgi:hypothetical protein
MKSLLFEIALFVRLGLVLLGVFVLLSWMDRK